jgi:hypothetical protein
MASRTKAPPKRIPTKCPACSSRLEITELQCPACGTSVRGSYPLDRFAALTPEDEELLLAFLIARGSLKEVQERLDLSYPTVRNRLDRLVVSLGLAEEPKPDEPDTREPERKESKVDVLDLLDKLEAGDVTVDTIIESVRGERDGKS